ncbi:uncharacterized protein J4E84_001437 [Alternaria hordeiaustralica]|uniref:uncharacterized protein n=1 Tax=Alternaria hordeiaustralica TaxID=1187925 RepID=UPI0020C3567D|nr:uncharacterized protein J4E84_001437 [Alternaria hordeiaustralica]KAI4698301.1 hypothetical protein J4E84_001437 [Alternaria hordeiaustralica]
MPDVVSAVPTSNRQAVPKSPTELAAPPSIDGSLAPMRRVSELLVRIADQEADNARLQQEKTAAKKMSSDYHIRLTQATKSLGDLTVSYSKRLEEKDALLNENVAIEQRDTLMRKDTAKSAREISDMTSKIQEMEAQIQAYEVENKDLQNRVTTLETEAHSLQCHVQDLEFEREQGRASESIDGYGANGRRDSTQRPMSNVDATPPRQGSDRDRESRYSEAVYTEHRRTSGGFYERGGHQRGARRERDRGRNVRNRSSTNDRFVPDLYPPTGPRADRR